MDRSEKRKAQRTLDAFTRKAKEDMADWVDKLIAMGHTPSKNEYEAFKSGYIYATNRINNKD